jgi:hypothetical protein
MQIKKWQRGAEVGGRVGGGLASSLLSFESFMQYHSEARLQIGAQQGVQGCAGVRNRTGLQEEMLLRSPSGLPPGPVIVLPPSSQGHLAVDLVLDGGALGDLHVHAHILVHRPAGGLRDSPGYRLVNCGALLPRHSLAVLPRLIPALGGGRWGLG